MDWIKINKDETAFNFLNENIVIGNEYEAFDYLLSSSQINYQQYQKIYKLLKRNLSYLFPITLSNVSSINTSSFIISWNSIPFITKYFINVSEYQTFSNSIYTNFEIFNTKSFITGLQAGTNYYYTIRAGNEFGYSDNSKIFSTITVPPKPVALPPTEITTESFIANWSETKGADSYRLDVSTNSMFQNYLPGYHDKLIIGTNQKVTGSFNNIAIYYKVRAVNKSGTSIDSDIMSTQTPLFEAYEALEVSYTSFKASWSHRPGTEYYKLDVSTDIMFNSFVEGYHEKIVYERQCTVYGLLPSTTYYYRVKAKKIDGSDSIYTNVVSVQTNAYKVLTIRTVTAGRARIILDPVDINGKQYETSWGTGILLAGGIFVPLQSFEYAYETDVTLTALDDGNDKFVKWEIKDPISGIWSDPIFERTTTLIGDLVNRQIRATWQYVTPIHPFGSEITNLESEADIKPVTK